MSESKLDLILTKLGSMESELTTGRNEQQEMKSELTLVRNEQQEMKSELTSVRNEQQEMKNDISEMKQTQTDMLKRFDDIERKSDAIMGQVVKNAEDITMIKDNQQIIAEIIKRQEDTINILARRSIDQEAEIKRIKQ